MPVDGRQSPTALAVARGTTRLLHSLGYLGGQRTCRSPPAAAPISWRSSATGEIWIVEIKSSVADFRADQKWMDYRLHCDRLFFATTIDVPCDIFPPDTGLIVADAFGASVALRGAGAPAACRDPQEHAARLRARRRAAPVGARRSGGRRRRGVLVRFRRAARATLLRVAAMPTCDREPVTHDEPA